MVAIGVCPLVCAVLFFTVICCDCRQRRNLILLHDSPASAAVSLSKHCTSLKVLAGQSYPVESKSRVVFWVQSPQKLMVRDSK